MPKSLPNSISWTDTFNVGIDTGSPVDDQDYQVPFPFTGTINKLTVSLGPEQLTPAEREMIYGTYRDRQQFVVVGAVACRTGSKVRKRSDEGRFPGGVRIPLGA